jgi:hypothetical protein
MLPQTNNSNKALIPPDLLHKHQTMVEPSQNPRTPWVKYPRLKTSIADAKGNCLKQIQLSTCEEAAPRAILIHPREDPGAEVLTTWRIPRTHALGHR